MFETLIVQKDKVENIKNIPTKLNKLSIIIYVILQLIIIHNVTS